jgi:hypothetical protein
LRSLELSHELVKLDADTSTPIHKKVSDDLANDFWVTGNANVLQQRLHQSLASLLLPNRADKLQQGIEGRSTDRALNNLAKSVI